MPRQLYDFAAPLLAHAAPEITPPRWVRPGPADPDLRRVRPEDVAGQAVSTAREYAGWGLFVGIVCPEQARSSVESRLHADGVQWSDASSGNLGASINLVSASEAKGLEFDAVVVVEPVAIVAEVARGRRMLDIALTRITRFLSVVHSRAALPLPASSDEPDPSLAVVIQEAVPAVPGDFAAVGTAPLSSGAQDTVAVEAS